jgi:hypothetical protein
MTRRSNRFRLLRFRSPLLSQSRFLYFPPGTEMVHFPGFARARLWIHRAVQRVCLCGFPHSEIPGSMPACGSPRLIAACHVLLRLLLPRHPPCALSSLTTKFTRHTAVSLDLSTLSSRAKHQFREAELMHSRGTLGLIFRKTTKRRLNFMGLILLIARRTPTVGSSTTLFRSLAQTK